MNNCLVRVEQLRRSEPWKEKMTECSQRKSSERRQLVAMTADYIGGKIYREYGLEIQAYVVFRAF